MESRKSPPREGQPPTVVDSTYLILTHNFAKWNIRL